MATAEQQLKAMIANMPDKTGKPLDDWLAIVASSGLAKHGEIVTLLKSEHGMGHGFANVIAHKALGGDESSADDLLAAQYAEGKAHLRPVYDAIEAYVKTLGSDVEIAPKKTSVSFRRSKQFALAQPTTKTRIDLGVNLKGREPSGRLEAWSGMTSHRVRLQSPSDFDRDVQQWLAEAYQNA